MAEAQFWINATPLTKALIAASPMALIGLLVFVAALVWRPKPGSKE